MLIATKFIRWPFSPALPGFFGVFQFHVTKSIAPRLGLPTQVFLMVFRKGSVDAYRVHPAAPRRSGKDAPHHNVSAVVSQSLDKIPYTYVVADKSLNGKLI